MVVKVYLFNDNNNNAQSKMHKHGRGVGKVSTIVNRMAINKRFVINMILFITVFAQRSNMSVPFDIIILCYIYVTTYPADCYNLIAPHRGK